LFIEHGHRLLGVVAGMLNIALVLAVFRWDRRVWMRYFSLGALAAVILQGCLGGFRVLLDDRQLAMLHGCAGPAFFAVCVALCVVTSRTWRESAAGGAASERNTGSEQTVVGVPLSKLPALTVATAAAAYVQLVVGALMRHVPVTATPNFFAWTVYGHLIVGGLVTALALAIVWLMFRGRNRLAGLRGLANTLVILIVCQLLLGCATWVVNYYWPGWVPDWSWTARYALIEAKGWLQTMVVTAHQAMGSLIIGVSVWLMLCVYRRAHVQPEFHPAGAALAGGVVA
jgi:cytochrome c oxidase assembly protein subunit 15